MNSKLYLFLSYLAARHVSAVGALSNCLKARAKGEQSEISVAYIPSGKVKFAAHLASVVGQDDDDERAAMLAKACTIAIEDATASDEEMALQLVDAIKALCVADSVPAAPACNLQALCDEFKGTEVEVVTRNGNDYYTFKGRTAYPAELQLGDKTLKLANASYRKGTYYVA